MCAIINFHSVSPFLWLQHLKFLSPKPLDKLFRKSYNTPTLDGRNPLETDHMIWPQLTYKKLSAPLMLDHIIWGADFMTTCLTTFRTGLPGDSSTTRTLYQSFRTKNHVLYAISRKKLHPFAWGGRGRKFKSCHSDQLNGRIISFRFSLFYKGFSHFLSVEKPYFLALRLYLKKGYFWGLVHTLVHTF